VPYGITQCYLPSGRGDITAFTPSQLRLVINNNCNVAGCESQKNRTYGHNHSSFYRLDASLLPNRHYQSTSVNSKQGLQPRESLAVFVVSWQMWTGHPLCSNSLLVPISNARKVSSKQCSCHWNKILPGCHDGRLTCWMTRWKDWGIKVASSLVNCNHWITDPIFNTAIGWHYDGQLING